MTAIIPDSPLAGMSRKGLRDGRLLILFRSLTFQLFVGLVGIAALCLTVVSVATLNVTAIYLQGQLSDDMLRDQRRMEGQIEFGKLVLLERARSLAGTEALVQAVANGDVQRLNEIFDDSRLAATFQALVITDAAGSALLSIDRHSSGAFILADPGPVQRSLQGQEISTLIDDAHGLGRLVALPVEHGVNIVGSLLMVNYLDSSTLQNMRQMFGREFLIWRGDEPLLSTIDSQVVLELIRNQVRITRELGRYGVPDGITLADGSELTVLVSPRLDDSDDTSNLFVMVASNQEVDDVLNQLQWFILYVGLALAVVVLPLSFFMARLISQPIKELAEMTRQLGKGNLEVQVEVKRDDIVGHLVGAFNTMARDLKYSTTSIESLNLEIKRRSEVEFELRQSERRFRSLAANIPGAIFRCQQLPRWQMTYLSGRIQEICGYPSTEFVGDEARSINSVIHPEDLPGLLGKGMWAATADQHYRREYRILRRDGQVVHVLEAGRSYAIADTGEVFTDGVLIDISAQKQAEIERDALVQQLLQSQKMESLGVLSGGIAHDFNNILSAILGYAKLAQAQVELGSELEEHIEHVLAAGQRGRDITSQILAFSRQVEVETHPMAVLPIIEEVAGLMRASLPRHVVLEQSVIEGGEWVTASPTALHQILMNLCTNAIQAMEETGGQLRLSSGPAAIAQLPAELIDSDHQRWVCIEVADQGRGIPSDTLERIYEPFFTTREVGTGMGLAAVHGIVRNLGGAIECRSEADVGSVFSVYLPAGAQPSDSQETVESPPVMGEGRLLYVDDEPSLVKLASIQPAMLGYEVTGEQRPEQGLAAFAEDPNSFQLVITDYSMPGMNGLELAEKLVQIRPDIKIILMTGLDPEISEDERRRLGIREVLQKPCMLEDLSEALCRVLEASGA